MNLIPRDISRRAGGFQVTEEENGEGAINYGGSLGYEKFTKAEHARVFGATWAEDRAKRLELEAVTLRHAAALLRRSE